MASSSSGPSAKNRDSIASSVTSSTASTDAAPIVSTSISERGTDDNSKLKTLLSILRKFIGVTDIAAVRFSLPAQLLEPTPNLEYWNYLDRPETFVSIDDSEDPLGRMLAVLRFWFSKDIKYVKGKPCKPYNSVLGEFFRCNWLVEDNLPPLLGQAQKTSLVSGHSTANKPVKVSYLTEQTSHHPPVSAFFVDCPEKGITARGYDQLSAKFTGTSIRVTPGNHNLGIFITLQNRGNEEYQLTHPIAHLGGFLRGSLSITVVDTCTVTCPKTRIKVILHYLEEGWLGKTQNKVHGVIYNYDPDTDNRSRIKDVPEKDILARVEGYWHDKIHYTLIGSKDSHLLIDLNPLFQVPKIIPPMTEQLSYESRRFWKDVTQAILDKQFTQATKLKQELEERQRERAAAREAQNQEWKPQFFSEVVAPTGKPSLTAEGVRALRGLHQDNFHLEEHDVVSA